MILIIPNNYEIIKICYNPVSRARIGPCTHGTGWTKNLNCFRSWAGKEMKKEQASYTSDSETMDNLGVQPISLLLHECARIFTCWGSSTCSSLWKLLLAFWAEGTHACESLGCRCKQGSEACLLEKMYCLTLRWLLELNVGIVLPRSRGNDILSFSTVFL